MMPDMKFSAKRLIGLREAKGWKRAELARQADIDPAQLMYIERGKRQPIYATAARLAAALGVSMDDFREPEEKQE